MSKPSVTERVRMWFHCCFLIARLLFVKLLCIVTELWDVEPNSVFVKLFASSSVQNIGSSRSMGNYRDIECMARRRNI